jgi:dolichyl-phosphate beta-glucosyltransferase
MADARPDLTLVLPAFNEAGTIAATLREAADYFRARSLGYEIVVAADGDDGTREICRDLAGADPAIRVIGGETRRGKGRGVREAVALAAGTIIGYADADNKVPIREFDKISPWLPQYPIVIGSRAIDRSLVERRQPLYRRVGSVGFHCFMQTVVGLPGITDSQCGFKFFHRDVARDLFARQRIDGYMFDVEILYLARKRGYPVHQVPIRWRDDADSRLELVAGNLRNVRDIFRIRLLTGRVEPAPEPARSPAARRSCTSPSP